MSLTGAMLNELDERTIARRVARPHDEARLSFHLARNVVGSYDEFADIMARYVQHHHTSCIAPGGRLSRIDAAGQAKEILKQEYRRQGGDDVSAYHDCKDGVNGGLRQVCDLLCDHLKAEAIENYTRDVFDRYLPPADNYSLRVQMVSDFIRHCGVALPGIDVSHPSRYSERLEELVRAFVRGLRQISTIFRRR
jgi:hypothetical protein